MAKPFKQTAKPLSLSGDKPKNSSQADATRREQEQLATVTVPSDGTEKKTEDLGAEQAPRPAQKSTDVTEKNKLSALERRKFGKFRGI